MLVENSSREISLQAKLKTLARAMRKHSTAAERILWNSLKSRQLSDEKFRRQHPLYNFIVDFYCYNRKIIIEVDGPVHEYQLTRDVARDHFFEIRGYTVLRFSNDEVIYDLQKVLSTITRAINQ